MYPIINAAGRCSRTGTGETRDSERHVRGVLVQLVPLCE
jgi:hypothetical protein